MIAGLSKAVTLYLAPLLSLTAILLSLFAFLAPTLLLHDRVALLTVTPSVSLTQPGSSQSVDGPSVFLGVLGISTLLTMHKRLAHTHTKVLVHVHKTPFQSIALPRQCLRFTVRI